MSNKKITREDLIATEGPMNNVASDDAIVQTDAEGGIGVSVPRTNGSLITGGGA